MEEKGVGGKGISRSSRFLCVTERTFPGDVLEGENTNRKLPERERELKRTKREKN